MDYKQTLIVELRDRWLTKKDVEIVSTPNEMQLRLDNEQLDKYDSLEYVTQLVKKCIDLKECQNSWHIDYEKFRTDKEIQNKVLNIIDDYTHEGELKLKLLAFTKKLIQQSDLTEEETK